MRESVSHRVARTALLLLGLGLIFWLAACAGTPAPVAAPTTLGARLNVVSTVSPLVNIIYNIGGSRVDLEGIIPEGTDSHTFEPAPSDANKLAHADLIIVNGLDLETPTVKLAQANKKPSAEIVELGPQTIQPDQYVYDFSFPKELGKPNPHLWLNPMNALRYAEIARDALARRDSTRRMSITITRTTRRSEYGSINWTRRSKHPSPRFQKRIASC